MQRRFMIQSVLHEERLLPGSVKTAPPLVTLTVRDMDGSQTPCKLGFDPSSQDLRIQYGAPEDLRPRPGQVLVLTFSLEEGPAPERT